MKRRWKYLLGAFLLAAGLLTGCSGEAIQPMPTAPPAQSQEVQMPETESPDNEMEEAESSGVETEEAEESEAESPASDIEEVKQPETENPGSETEEAKKPETESPDGETEEAKESETESPEAEIREDGTYTSKEEVAAYLNLYGHLPDNFITKKEAKALGWVSSEGNLAEAAPGKSIGGDYFGNFEGNLPEKKGREYHECDIDSDGGYRGAKRLVYSNDGLIYYTEDHYKTFELLYGEE